VTYFQIAGQSGNTNFNDSFGNCHNSDQRVIAAGYDNGDVKLFDLKTQMFLWDTNLKNGVCGL